MTNKKVLFIAAHPDDIDLGCSIAIHNHYLKGDEIISLILTKGEQGTDSFDRLIEQDNSLEILAPHSNKIFKNFPDTKLFIHTNEIINEIKSVANQYTPDIIYIPSKHDTHQDHITVYNCSLSVFNNLNINKIISYETPSTTSLFSPNYFVFCNTDQFKIKLRALQCHKSQLNKSYFSNDVICSLAKMRASQGKVYNDFLAEAYEIVRINTF